MCVYGTYVPVNSSPSTATDTVNTIDIRQSAAARQSTARLAMSVNTSHTSSDMSCTSRTMVNMYDDAVDVKPGIQDDTTDTTAIQQQLGHKLEYGQSYETTVMYQPMVE